ncbi:MAG TPA: hypothetical protein VF368_03630 [Gemmatimonadaceae bacterium]
MRRRASSRMAGAAAPVYSEGLRGAQARTMPAAALPMVRAVA